MESRGWGKGKVMHFFRWGYYYKPGSRRGAWIKALPVIHGGRRKNPEGLELMKPDDHCDREVEGNFLLQIFFLGLRLLVWTTERMAVAWLRLEGIGPAGLGKHGRNTLFWSILILKRFYIWEEKINNGYYSAWKILNNRFSVLLSQVLFIQFLKVWKI